MVLGTDRLVKLVDRREQPLVENLDRSTQPEGTGFDLRAGELFKLKGRGYLGIVERDTPGIKSVAVYSEKKTRKVVLRTGSYFLVKTVERLNLPKNIIGYVWTRTTLFRCGVYLKAAPVSPGYKGELTLGLFNAGPSDFTLEMGARIGHITFHNILGKAVMYRGQWQGGRVATAGREKQR